MSRPILEYITPSLLERFWSKVDNGCPDDCWEWTACRTDKGYGQIGVSAQRTRLANRVSWVIAHGKEIPEGLQVLHSCDNPPCCNPNHLSVGTHAENMKQMNDRKRCPRPQREDHHKVTVNDEAAVAGLIRWLHGEINLFDLSVELGTSRTSVGYWARGTFRPNLIEKAVWLA